MRAILRHRRTLPTAALAVLLVGCLDTSLDGDWSIDTGAGEGLSVTFVIEPEVDGTYDAWGWCGSTHPPRIQA